MLIFLEGDVPHKAFHDPLNKTIDLWSGSAEAEGAALAFGEALVVACNDEGVFSHLSLEYGGLSMDSVLPTRPDECPIATSAEVELDDADALHVLLDPTEGTLRFSFGGRVPQQWARLGENLIWLGIDPDGHLAAMMIEGISRDTGGKAQGAWLAQMRIG